MNVNKLKLALLFLYLFSIGEILGQATIDYPSPAAGLSVCQDNSELTVEITITNNDADNCNITLELPPGIVYVPGSVATVSSNNGLTVFEESIADLNAPIIRITPPDLIAGDMVTFTITRTADCEALLAAQAGTVFKDSVYVNSDLGLVVSELDPLINSYDVLFPSMSLLQPPSVTGAVNSTHDRDIKITNGGFGCLNEVDFYTVNSGNTHNSLTASGTTVVPTNVSGDTVFYTLDAAVISGFGNADACFDNGEEITITENFTIKNCSPSSSYVAGWGCSSSVCQEQVKNGQINIANGVPNITTQEALFSSGNSCTNAIFEVTYTNNGTEAEVGAGTAYGMIFKFGMGYSNSILFQTHEHFANFSINGTPLTDTLVNGYGNGIDSPQFVNMAELASDPDGAGVGLDDLDGDGEYDDLPVGQSVVVRVEVEYDCKVECPTYHYYQRFQNQTCYLDQCSAAKETSIISRSNHLSYYEISDGTTAAGPTDVADNQTITFEVCQSYRLGIYGGLGCPTDTVSLQMILPAGVTYAGNPTMDGALATGTANGDTLMVSGKLNNGGELNVCFTTDITFSCAAWDGEPLEIATSVVYNCDNSCECIQEWGCTDLNLVPHCPGCVDGGLTTYNSWSERLNLGYADPSGTTLADPATLPAQNLKTALPCDSVRIYAVSTQIGATSYDNAHLEMKYTMPGGSEAFSVSGGQVDIIDVSSDVTYTCEMPAPVQTIVADTIVHHWDFTPLIGDPVCGLPAGFMFEQDDSVDVYIDVKILENASYENIPSTTLADLRFKHYNLAPITNEEMYCDTWGSELYLHKREYEFWVGSGGVNNGCTSFSNWMSYRFMHGSSDIYPGEIRPYAKVDSFVVVINTGDVFDPSVTPELWSRGTPADGYPGDEIVTNLPPPTIVGNRLTWVNTGDWPLGDMIVTGHSGYWVAFNLMTTCGSVPGNVDYKVYTTEAGDFDDPSCYNPVLVEKSRFFTNRQPSLSVTDLTGCISATKPVEFWDLEIRNTTGARDAEYVWVGFEDLLSGINVTNVLDLNNGGIPITTLNYADGKWIQLTDLLAGGTTYRIRIEFEYTSCEPDELRVLSSFDCGVYPSDPTILNCTPAETILEVKPVESEVQINRTQWPIGAQNLCDTLFYEIELNSSQLSYLVDPSLDILLATGLTLAGDPLVEYPGGSNAWEAIPATINGSLANIAINQHSAVSMDGIPGTQDALVPEDRNVKVQMKFITDCSFFAGSRFQFIAHGDQPCTGPALGDGVTSVTPPIDIAGVSPPYSTINTITSDPLQGCTNAETIEFDVLFTGGSTSGNDTAYITIPQGIEYVANSFACMPATAVPSCPTLIDAITDVSGITKLKMAYPAGITDGSQVMFSIDVMNTPDGGCSTPKLILLENVISVPGPACATAPGGFCPEIGVVSGSKSIDIEIQKPDLALDNLCGFYSSWPAGTSFQLEGDIVNSGSDLPANDSLYVEVFCADATGAATGAPIGSIVIPGPLAAGATATFSGVVVGSCDPTLGVVSTIQPMNSLGKENCMCNDLASFFCNDLVLPIECSSFSGESTTKGIDLTWTTEFEIDNKGFYLHRSEDGLDYRSIAWIDGSGETTEQTTYRFTDPEAIFASTYYYKISQLDLDGSSEFVCDVLTVNTGSKYKDPKNEVYPNPTEGLISIVTYSSIENDYVNVNVFSSLGERIAVMQKDLSSGFNSFEFDLSEFAPGVYFIQLENSNKQHSEHRIVKANYK